MEKSVDLFKSVFIFGSSSCGIKAYNILKENYNIKGFLDNDKNKWHKDIYGMKIYNPDILKEDKNSIVYIASIYYDEISEQLKRYGVNYRIAPVMYLSKDEKLIDDMSNSIKVLYNKIKKINIKTMNISDYSKKYLSDYSRSLSICLQKYGEIILYLYEKFILTNKIPIENVIFLDYGAGTGLLSLVALQFGIKNVYYNDIYEVSVKDAKVISDELGYARTRYITGDLDAVINYSQNNNVKFNLIASYDVIEHIYDLNDYFSNINKCCEKKYGILMASSANSYNASIVRKLKEQHDDIENNDREEVYGCKKRDSLKAYRTIRERIIKSYITNLKYNINEMNLEEFLILTKGMKKEDIELSLEKYFRKSIKPKQKDIKFTSNTCDPLTGNWAEHLIDFDNLILFIEKLGMVTAVVPKGNGIETSDIIGLYAEKKL